ncbi:MAG: hypothetical protein JO348_14680 [Alphaproteobacteria bacterium]|nr:hypothetical protein [Alphaproteobacteria bacterium]MBV9421010.1 hypothetical protein [Alphaproteobacteria bacterium]MBV9540774.1 hypothetical protein [Alphaproteobacteria bacterium]MBV9904292.1 hypothetical protein [Alphaproteobacteria bacterium]
MKFTTTILSAAALTLVLGAATANAAGFSAEPTFASCVHLKKKVSDALQANQSSDKYTDASRESRNAQTFCNSGLYKNGVEGYGRALALLGVS